METCAVRGSSIASSTQYLQPFQPAHAGLDVDRFVRDLTACCAEILDRREPSESVSLDPRRVPEIVLDRTLEAEAGGAADEEG